PGRFRCQPGAAACFPREWRCDGHPDCEDEEDEQGCGTATPAEPSPDGAWVTPPRSSAALGSAGTGGAAGPRAEGGLGGECFSACALSSLVLLSILGAVGSLAVWGLSKAKSRSNIFSLENASREQLVPDKSR
ncbi:RSVR protein, partial [Chordeiles acutipennis]|nr:RSVR protein [Chordeiles acutipennis]